MQGYYTPKGKHLTLADRRNIDRLIRRWLPKGSKNATQQQVAFIEHWINNYPKKVLDYKSPRDFFQDD